MGTKTRLAMSLAAAALLLHASRAWAAFHFVVIDQVFLGTADCPNAQYVLMRMFIGGQTQVSGHGVPGQNADGSSAGEFGSFASDLSNGATNAVFIMGTAEAAGLFGLAMDQVATGHLSVGSGRVCWDTFDCVAYGDFTGNNTPRGQPAESPPLGMALVRQTSTNNNAADFDIGSPAPRNNAGDTGTLGQCPSGEATPTEVIEDPTPTATTGPATGCTGDCNGDGRVIVNELVLGVGIALESNPLSVCPSFDLNHSEAVEVNELISGVRAALEGCPATPTATATDSGQPLPSATPTTVQQAALGVRRFTVDPGVSRFVGVFPDGTEVVATGLQGFLEMRAGAPDPDNGVAFVDVTDASEYLSVDARTAGRTVCFRVLRDRLSLGHAGILACDGGVNYGVRLTQNHSIGVVGTCTVGGNACSGDGECAGSECFTAARCTGAGGTVEAAGQPHAGVCNGPFEGALDPPSSPPGTLFIASDPTTRIINGLPVEILQEHELPCGDEGVSGRVVALTLTSDHAIGRVLNLNTVPGETLEATIAGEPFPCDTWAQEDGPGVLVLSAPTLDTEIAPGHYSDIVAHYVLAD